MSDAPQSAAKAAAPLSPLSTDPAPKSPEPIVATPDPLPTQTASEASAASARALDDLVAGLNKTVAAPAVAPEPVVPAPVVPAPVVPVAAAEAPIPVASEPVVAPAAVTPVAAATATEAVASSSPAVTPGRSFEDVVADMLRPLLEKWIDENMPRIVERALQRDATLTRKSNT
jgi:cell pole-organizing protein PopZ